MSTVRRPTIQQNPLPALSVTENRPNPENFSPLKNLLDRRKSSILGNGPLTSSKNRILFHEQQKVELRRAVIRGDYMNGAHDHVITGEFKTTFHSWNLRKWQLLFYLSANEQDSALERHFIHHHLVPKLRQHAWAYDIEVICIDMKLGSPDDHDVAHQLWNDSSKEIEKCRNNSCGLFFLSLQNDLYGDRPLPSHIEKRNFEDRVEACFDKDLIEMARDWYILDTAGDPSCYRLKDLNEVTSTQSDPSSTWCYFHDLVIPHLRTLFLDVRFDKYVCRDVAVGKSFVEWEVKYAFKQEEDLHRILWFQRQVTDDHFDMNFMNHPDDKVVVKLCSELRDFMTKRLNKLLISDIITIFETKYLSLMTQGGGYTQYENKWMSQGYLRLKAELDMIIQTKLQWQKDGNGLNIKGDIFGEFLYHCHLAHNYCKHSYPRAFLLQEAVRLAGEPNRRVHDPRNVIAKNALRSDGKKQSGATGRYNCISFVVVGDSATGKSSFLAQLGNQLYELEESNPLVPNLTRPVLIRFCGTTVNSSHGMNLSTSLRHQIEYILGPYPSSKGITDLEILRELLAYHAVILLLDGVNNIADELNFLVDLNPNNHTRIILSTLSSHSTAQLLQEECIPVIQLPPILDTSQPRVEPPSKAIHSQSGTPSKQIGRPLSRNAVNAGSPKTLSPMRHNIHPSPKQKLQVLSPNSSPSSVSLTSSSLNSSPLKGRQEVTADMYLEKKEILYHLLKHKRRLSDQQWESLLPQLPQNSSVLYFRIYSCIFEYMTAIPLTVPTPEQDISALFNRFLDLVENDSYSKEACILCLSYLSLSCSGIKDNEMDDLLSLDDNLALLSSSVGINVPLNASTISRAPSKIWSKIKRKLRYFLRENITGCNIWSNDILIDLAKARYITPENSPKLHFTLSSYYSNKLSESIRQKRSIPSMELLLSGTDVWDEKSIVNYRRCEESIRHLVYSNQLQEAIDELCSLEYLCCCLRCDLLEKVISYFEIIRNILQDGPIEDLQSKRVNDYHTWLTHSFTKLKLYSYRLISITITAEPESSIARSDFIRLSQDSRYLHSTKFQSTGSSWIRGFSFQVERVGASNPSQLLNSISSPPSINCVCWSPDFAYLVSGSDDCKIRMWRLATFSLVHTLSGHDQPVTSICYNPNGRQLLSGARDHKLCLWDALTGVLIRNFPSEHTLDITTVVWNPCYSEIATGSKDSKVILWSYEAQERKSTSDNNSGNIDGGGTLTATGELRTVTLKKYDDYYINQLCYSPDGIELAVANFSTTVRVWNLVERKSRVYTGHKQQVCSIDWNPKDNKIASASDDGTVQIWNSVQVNCTFVKFRQHNGKAVKTVNWCPNGEIIVSSDCEGMILIWNSKANNEIYSCLYGHFDVISSLKWSNNSQYLLSGSKDGNMIVWDSVAL